MWLVETLFKPWRTCLLWEARRQFPLICSRKAKLSPLPLSLHGGFSPLSDAEMSKFTNFYSFSLSFLHKDLLVCFLNLNLEMMKGLFRFYFFRIFLINFLCRVPLAFHAERLIPPVLLFFLLLFCVLFWEFPDLHQVSI